MTSELERFVGTSAAKPMRFGLYGFALAACGFALAMSIDYGPHNPWSLVALAVTGIGVAMGFIAIAWGWVTIARQSNLRGESRDEGTP